MFFFSVCELFYLCFDLLEVLLTSLRFLLSALSFPLPFISCLVSRFLDGFFSLAIAPSFSVVFSYLLDLLSSRSPCKHFCISNAFLGLSQFLGFLQTSSACQNLYRQVLRPFSILSFEVVFSPQSSLFRRPGPLLRQGLFLAQYGSPPFLEAHTLLPVVGLLPSFSSTTLFNTYFFPDLFFS